MHGWRKSTYNDIAEHFAVGEVEAAISISLKFNVFNGMFSAIPVSATAGI